jgi:hypothetical protein
MTGIPDCVLAALAFCGPPAATPPPCPPPTVGPPPVASWAQPAVTPNFEPVLVGGSVGTKRGRPAAPHEGVWGLDFVGKWRLKRVKLLWPFKTVEREPRHGKDPTHYDTKLPETPPPPVIKKL